MASSSRFYLQLSSSFLLLHSRTRNSLNLNLLNNKNPLFSPSLSSSLHKAFSSSSLRSAVTADDDTAAHPWPEWDQFVRKMRSKGYFAKAQRDASNVSSSSSSLTFLACLAFARERYDIIKYLPKEDIRTIVQCGCPNLFQKNINSAKRLRVFLRLDEGDVCSACNLQGSCDRAFVIEKDDDKAHTVDIMRILMNYAVDPALRSGGTNPSMTELVEESACKLLGKLIKLSDTTIDRTLPKPELHPPSKREPSEKSQKVISKSIQLQNIEMKITDWICSNCNFLNSAQNAQCLECKAAGPKRAAFGSAEMKFEDWTCPKCEFVNFARNKKCLHCKELRPRENQILGIGNVPSVIS